MQPLISAARRVSALWLLCVAMLLSPIVALRSEDNPAKPNPPAAQSASAGITSLEGEWMLHLNGKEIEAGRVVWVVTPGKIAEEKATRESYLIVPMAGGGYGITHGAAKDGWLVMFPPGPIFKTLPSTSHTTGRHYEAGPDLSFDTFVLQIRARPGGNEVEIWKSPGTYGVPSGEFTFSGYILVRIGAKSYLGAPDDFTL